MKGAKWTHEPCSTFSFLNPPCLILNIRMMSALLTQYVVTAPQTARTWVSHSEWKANGTCLKCSNLTSEIDVLILSKFRQIPFGRVPPLNSHLGKMLCSKGTNETFWKRFCFWSYIQMLIEAPHLPRLVPPLCKHVERRSVSREVVRHWFCGYF